MSHKGQPVNPDGKDGFGRPRRWARCEECGGELIRVVMLRFAQGSPERRDEWHHRVKKR